MGVWDSAVHSHSMGQVRRRAEARTHRNTEHTGTYTPMLHLRFSDLPLKMCPKKGPEMTKNSTKSAEDPQKKLTLFGGGERNLMEKRFRGHLGVSEFFLWKSKQKNSCR